MRRTRCHVHLGCEYLKIGKQMPEVPPAPPKLPLSQEKRLAWALKEYGHLLVMAVRRDTSPLARDVETGPEAQMPERVARLILDKADPT